MKTTAILVAVALVAMVTPISSANEKIACDNEAFFDEVLNTRPEGMDAVTLRPDTLQKLPVETVDKDALIADLADRVGMICMEELVSGASESGGFPLVSDFILMYEVNYDYTGQHCNQGELIGPGGHYTVAAPDPAAGTHSWSYGGPEFVGLAESGISHTSSAYFKYAFAADVIGGKAFNYAQDVTYAGASDFYCVGFFDPFFGDYVTVNLPYTSGIAA